MQNDLEKVGVFHKPYLGEGKSDVMKFYSILQMTCWKFGIYATTCPKMDFSVPF